MSVHFFMDINKDDRDFHSALSETKTRLINNFGISRFVEFNKRMETDKVTIHAQDLQSCISHSIMEKHYTLIL